MTAALEELEAAFGHRFADRNLLIEALSHSSLGGLEQGGGKRGTRDYERLEFLGDRVLGLLIAEWLLERFPAENEGALSRRHAGLVRREALAEVARGFGLGDHLRLSPGEAAAGGRANDTILADACEAVIGALYLDGGLETARGFLRRYWAPRIDNAVGPPVEPKTGLQEWAQGRGMPLPVYSLLGRDGPDHEPRFRVAVSIASGESAEGTGNSKRNAEKAAAGALLDRLEGRKT